MAGDFESLLLEEIADGIVGSMFFIGELGVGPNLGEFSCESFYTNPPYKRAALRGSEVTS